jgi:hypothetical protein
VLALPCRTVDHGNVLRLGITANATAEPASRIERFIRSGQRPLPNTLAVKSPAVSSFVFVVRCQLPASAPRFSSSGVIKHPLTIYMSIVIYLPG